MSWGKKQYVGISMIAGVLFGILVLPILVNRIFGIDTIYVVAAVIVLYIGLNFGLKRSDFFN